MNFLKPILANDRHVRPCLFFLLAAAIVICGCGKKKEALPPAAAEAVNAPLAPGQTAMPVAAKVKQPVPVLTQADGQVDLPEIQRTVIRWIVSNRRRPASFEEFAATAGAPIPPPPAGKKYIITRDMHVQLVAK